MALLLCVGILAGCDSLPADLEKRAESYPTRFDEMQQRINARAREYADSKQAADWSFFEPYATRENWDAYYTDAAAELARVRSVYEKEVKPLLEADESAGAGELKAQLDRIDKVLIGIVDTTLRVTSRKQFLNDAKANAENWVQVADKEQQDIDALVGMLQPVVDAAQSDYVDRAEDIAGMYAPILKMQTDANAALQSAQTQLAIHRDGGFVDYAVLGDSTVAVTENLESLKKADPELRGRLDELYQSYTKILADMNVEYWVTVGRTSWDDFSDWPTEHTYEYPPMQVDEATFAYLANQVNEATVATYGCFLSCGSSVKISQPAWRQLSIEGREEQSWPGGDDSAEFWLADWEARYFHKYLLVNNGEKEETDWVEVDEDDFFDYENALGMEIESKPYGAFASELVSDPVPAGMSMVGNPAYGQWKEDSSGNSFWVFYGQYALIRDLVGGPGYSSRDYNDYRNWRNTGNRDWGYYGRDRTNPVYGTWSNQTRNSARWQSTSFGRTGGFRTADASVRGAGPSGRARGPGSGGK